MSRNASTLAASAFGPVDGMLALVHAFESVLQGMKAPLIEGGCCYQFVRNIIPAGYVDPSFSLDIGLGRSGWSIAVRGS